MTLAPASSIGPRAWRGRPGPRASVPEPRWKVRPRRRSRWRVWLPGSPDAEAEVDAHAVFHPRDGRKKIHARRDEDDEEGQGEAAQVLPIFRRGGHPDKTNGKGKVFQPSRGVGEGSNDNISGLPGFPWVTTDV